jgi:hypothetical protein
MMTSAIKAPKMVMTSTARYEFILSLRPALVTYEGMDGRLYMSGIETVVREQLFRGA